MLEDIGKIPSIKKTLKNAIFLNGFLYSKVGVVNMMREFTGQRELLRPTVTRFAMAFITLQSIHKQKTNLRKMFISEQWTQSKWAKEVAAKKSTAIVMSTTFWSSILNILKLSGPLVSTLRLVDGKKKLAMRYKYYYRESQKHYI